MGLPTGNRFTAILDLVRSLLNASTDYGVNDDLKRHPDDELIDAIRFADEQVVGALLSVLNHPRRSDYLTAVPIIHGENIPSHIGAIGAVKVDGLSPQYLPSPEIEILRAANTAGRLLYSGPYFDVDGERLYYSGSTATVDIARYNETGGTLQSPPEYDYAVVDLALAHLFAKEGSETPTAQHFGDLAMKALEWVRAGAEQIPRPIAYKRT